MEVARYVVQDYIKDQKIMKKRKHKPTPISNSKTLSQSFSLPKSKKRANLKKSRAYEVFSQSDPETEASLSSDDSDECEHAQISRALISRMSSSTWVSDTGVSFFISDQLSLFRSLTAIPRQTIIVGGSRLCANAKGIVKVTCEDESSMYLSDVLFVPKLGINLISSRKICRHIGLQGTFDQQNIFFTKDDCKLIIVTMKNGLYIVSHISKDIGKIVLPHLSCWPAKEEIMIYSNEILTENTELKCK